MMNLTPPVGWFELASKHDLEELEGRITNSFDGTVSRLEASMTKTFVTWLLASQATTIAILGTIVAMAV